MGGSFGFLQTLAPEQLVEIGLGTPDMGLFPCGAPLKQSEEGYPKKALYIHIYVYGHPQDVAERCALKNEV